MTAQSYLDTIEARTGLTAVTPFGDSQRRTPLTGAATASINRSSTACAASR